MFQKYFSIGILNTLLHWLIFAIALQCFGIGQGSANLIAFVVAVTFSFYMNAKFTFKKQATGLRYVLFVGFMGLLSYGIAELICRRLRWRTLFDDVS
ncbi:translocase [Wohlfahrtiimonas chitiniclastica]|uniref:GtrA family protein n=1 Tax=Wohlfahrtiimonas chitiniclastica TaxID=400946 RepID=UPI000B98068F|nr:GtrA family protein [Wohlfahrtiimonas chitiniclastica]OYQ82215.1 translocase [Wohlfahrtiimonas chitiniclastica]